MKTTQLELVVVLFSCLFGASISHAQEPHAKEPRKTETTGIQGTPRTATQKIKARKASASSWQKLSDQQIARMFFPEEKLYFQLGFEGINEDLTTNDWGVVVHEVKRVVANLDDDPEDEMAVLLLYSTGLCTSCGGQVIVAILDKKNGKVRVAWRTEKYGAWDRDGTSEISTIKLIKKDKFYELLYIYTGTPGGVHRSKEANIARWDGKKFSRIWSHEVEIQDTGGHDAPPHDYVAKVDFLGDNKGAKRIRVASLYTTWPLPGEQRTQVKLDEDFVWSDKEQKYLITRKREEKYEKRELCVSTREPGREDYRDCRNMAYGRGLSNWEARMYDQAILDFTEAIQIDPKFADSYFYRGSAYQHKGQYDQAIADYTKVLEIKPTHAQAYIERANSYERKDRHDQAISDYTKVLEINPRSPDPYYYRAKVYERMGRYDEAISEYAKMFELTPGGPWNYIERGEVYYKKGDYDQAISDYTKALGMKPLTAWAYHARGLAYWKKGQYDKAINDLNIAVKNPNSFSEAYYYRGRVYMDKGDYGQAVADFDRAIESPLKNVEIYFFTAQAYERTGQTRKAIGAYKAVIQNASSWTSPLVEYASERITELEKK